MTVRKGTPGEERLLLERVLIVKRAPREVSWKLTGCLYYSFSDACFPGRAASTESDNEGICLLVAGRVVPRGPACCVYSLDTLLEGWGLEVGETGGTGWETRGLELRKGLER